MEEEEEEEEEEEKEEEDEEEEEGGGDRHVHVYYLFQYWADTSKIWVSCRGRRREWRRRGRSSRLSAVCSSLHCNR